MKLPFHVDEYRSRCGRVREAMSKRGVDALLVSDPGNIYWLTGAEDWAFYTPLFVVVLADDPMPYWYGREMDRPGARMSTWLDSSHILAYGEELVQHTERHPCDRLAELLIEFGHARGTIGYESESYYFTTRGFARLRRGLPDASIEDCDLLVNRLRMRKSEAELGYMRDAAEIAATVMTRATHIIAPGVRQCDLMAEIFRTQISPNENFGGTVTGLSPIILAGEKAATAHPAWSDEKFEDGQTVALELGGARRRYCCGLARTVHLGRRLPAEVARTAEAVEEGMLAVTAHARAGIEAQELHAVWQSVLDRYGLKKESRIGYGIGIGFPPDWGERAISLRAGDTTILEANMTFHVILGMWMEGWGLELSETIVLGDHGCKCLTNYPRGVLLKA